jgi:hypothetical protein
MRKTVIISFIAFLILLGIIYLFVDKILELLQSFGVI